MNQSFVLQYVSFSRFPQQQSLTSAKMALAGWRSQWIKRGKFELADERFEVDGIPRYSTESLKRDFLPRLSPEANRLLRRHHNFVRSQLIHYGVEFNDKNLTGNGTRFLKKALEAGLV